MAGIRGWAAALLYSWWRAAAQPVPGHRRTASAHRLGFTPRPPALAFAYNPGQCFTGGQGDGLRICCGWDRGGAGRLVALDARHRLQSEGAYAPARYTGGEPDRRLCDR